MSENILTPEEREAYDQMLYEAGYVDDKPRPSAEIGPALVALLTQANQAGRAWAQWVLDDFTEYGALAKFRKWSKQRDVVTVAGKSYTVTKPAAMGVRKRAEDGSTYYQATFWEDMTREELEQVIARAAKVIESEARTVALAKRLLALLERVPEATTVSEAAEALGLTTETYLAAVDAA